MSLDLSALGAYTEEHGPRLIRKAIAQGRTIQNATMIPNVKSATIIDTVTSTLAVQAGASGWNSAGSTVIGKVTLTVVPLQIQEDLSSAAAEAKNTQFYYNAGSNGAYSDTRFAEMCAEEKADALQYFNEMFIWSAGTNGLRGYFSSNSGSTGYVITGNSTNGFTSVTVSNVISLVDTLKANFPSPVKSAKDKLMFFGEDIFDLFVVAMKNGNFYHIDPQVQLDYYFNYLGFKLIGTPGLNGTNQVFALTKSNLQIPTDVLDETTKIDVFWDRGANQIKLAAYWKLGTGILFPQFCAVKL